MRKSPKLIVTFSLGEIISTDDGAIDVKAVSLIAEQFRRLVSIFRRMQIIAVVGAGCLGRNYIRFAKDHMKKGVNLDSISNRASRVNAVLLASVVRNYSVVTNARIPETMGEINDYLSQGFQAVILGELEPDTISESTAARIAQINRSPLVIVSAREGISSETNEGKLVMLPQVDRSYLRRLISSKVKDKVLGDEASRILLEKKSKGMKVMVTGYQNIFNSTKALILSKGKKTAIEGSTRILL